MGNIYENFHLSFTIQYAMPKTTTSIRTWGESHNIVQCACFTEWVLQSAHLIRKNNTHLHFIVRLCHLFLLLWVYIQIVQIWHLTNWKQNLCHLVLCSVVVTWVCLLLTLTFTHFNSKSFLVALEKKPSDGQLGEHFRLAHSNLTVMDNLLWYINIIIFIYFVEKANKKPTKVLLV